MSASALGARQREGVIKRPRRRAAVPGARTPHMVRLSEYHSTESAQCSFVDLGDSARVSLILTPQGRGSFTEQACELVGSLQAILSRQGRSMMVTCQTVFLRHAADVAECQRIFSDHFGAAVPVTNYVLQPPCCGAAVSLEAWAIGGADVRIERFGPHGLAVSYDSVRWVYCAGVKPEAGAKGVYRQMMSTMERMGAALTMAGSDFEHVVRTWFYLGGITEAEGGAQRYMEMNRARADFYRELRFGSHSPKSGLLPGGYPASTGIGTGGAGLVAGCLSLQTQRKDALLVHLENPQQTPAFAYHSRYSPKSPKFSRGTALVLGDYLTTWISGTASIVNSESCHPEDIEKQTEQTIENIERLISVDSFVEQGVQGTAACLEDFAKIRVYLKRPEHFAKCKAICQRRFGSVPAIYAVADVCRPELLVEIEGVAFSRFKGRNS